MTDVFSQRFWLLAVTAIFVAAGAAVPWSTRVAVGTAVGGVWNLANLWCLTRLLGAWLGPSHSRRRAIVWTVVKFPLLYGVAFWLLAVAKVSVVGFGVGFTIVLGVALGWLAMQAQRMASAGFHGR